MEDYFHHDESLLLKFTDRTQSSLSPPSFRKNTPQKPFTKMNTPITT